MAEREEDGRFGRLEASFNLDTVIDGRGGIFTWVPKESIKEFNLLYFTPGASRGDHAHPHFTEYFLIVEGSGAMVYRDPQKEEDDRIKYHMSKGDCVYTKPEIAHAFHAITPVTAVAMLTKPWDECNPPIVRMDVSRHLERKIETK